jgi:transcriptional regulator with XRE-family HTH domain
MPPIARRMGALPATVSTDALPRRDLPGAAIRRARLELGWSQTELGRRCGYSASQVSRWETGAVPLRDVTVLRGLATVLATAPETFGLSSTDTPAASAASRSWGLLGAPARGESGTGPKVSTDFVTMLREVDDPVRRRAFLAAAGLAGTGLAWSPTPRRRPHELTT